MHFSLQWFQEKALHYDREPKDEAEIVRADKSSGQVGAQVCLRFHEFEFDPIARELRAPGMQHHLAPKLAELLYLLATQPDQIVSKADIAATVWPETYLEDNTLARAISDLRHALGDTARAPRFIQTVPRRGYRFCATTERLPLVERRQPRLLDRTSGRLMLSAALFSLAALGISAFLLRSEPPAPVALSETPVVIAGAHRFVRLSAEGLVMSTQDLENSNQLLISTMNDEIVQLITAAEGDEVVFIPATWSPDGRSFVYYEAREGACRLKLAAIGADAVEPVTISERCPMGGITYADWSPAYPTEVFFTEFLDTEGDVIVRVDVETGERSYVVDRAPGPVMPRVSDSGMLAYRFFNPFNSSIHVVDLDSGAEQSFAVDRVFAFDWLDDHSLIFSGGWSGISGLFVLDVSTAEISLFRQLGDGPGGYLAWLDYERSVGLHYEMLEGEARIELVGATRSFAACLGDGARSPRFSPDGEHLMFLSHHAETTRLRLCDKSGRLVTEQPIDSQHEIGFGWIDSATLFRLVREAAGQRARVEQMNLQGRLISSLRLPLPNVTQIWPADGSWWVLASGDLYFWDRVTGPQLRWEQYYSGAPEVTAPHLFYIWAGEETISISGPTGDRHAYSVKPGYRSFLVHQGRIFAPSFEENGATNLAAKSIETGETIWSLPLLGTLEGRRRITLSTDLTGAMIAIETVLEPGTSAMLLPIAPGG